MILHITRKEILQGFLSLRFALTLALVSVAMVSGAFLFLADYQQQLADYDENVRSDLNELSRRAEYRGWLAWRGVFGFDHWVYRAPSSLAFLAEANERELPNAFQVNAFTMSGPTKKLRGNHFLGWSEYLDWALVVSMIMSFVAIVLVYDSISGEREDGTLKLSLSNPVPRSTIILGKYLGTMTILIIPLLVGMLFSMIVITTSGKLDLTGGDWVRIALVFLLSVLYSSIFIMLGIFVSSLFRSSAASLVILLLAWTLIVVVIPGIGGSITASLSGVPGGEILSRDRQAASQKAQQEYDARHPDAGPLGGGRWDPRLSFGKRQHVDDAVMAVRDRYQDAMIRQVRFGRNVTRVSPSVVYRRAVESIAGTGIDHYESFFRQVRQHKLTLRQFLLDHFPFNIHRMPDRQELVKAFPTGSLNIADVPRFRDEPISMEASVRNSLWDIAILLMFNVVFFMAAYLSFLNRNVR